MTTESIDDLLIQGVKELYYTEKQQVDALESLAEQTEDEEASHAFAEHRAETEKQVERLEKVFETLGEEPDAMEDTVVESMITEHEEFAQENEGEILSRYNMEAGQKTEHYEIAAYGSLASLAEKCGHDDVADLLHETLEEEKEALEEISKASEQYDEQQIAGD